jgi:hypothetical protein
MTPIKSWKLFILIFILLAVVFFAYMARQFDQATNQSERHSYSSTIEDSLSIASSSFDIGFKLLKNPMYLPSN